VQVSGAGSPILFWSRVAIDNRKRNKTVNRAEVQLFMGTLCESSNIMHAISESTNGVASVGDGLVRRRKEPHILLKEGVNNRKMMPPNKLEDHNATWKMATYSGVSGDVRGLAEAGRVGFADTYRVCLIGLPGQSQSV
jgi:hypothetical protein